MVVIQEKIVASGHGAFTAGQPTYFCVHSTANTGASAANHVAYWRNNPDFAVHLVVDKQEAFHTVPYDRVCWQVGNGNGFVEGVEVCENVSTRAEFLRTMDNAASVVAQRLKAHGWGLDRLITHKMAQERWGGSDHTDPIPFFTRWNYTWGDFKKLVQTHMNGDDDMVTQQDIEKIAKLTADKVWLHKLPSGAVARDAISPACQNAFWMRDKGLPAVTAKITALEAAMNALAKSVGANPDEIAKIVQDAVKSKLDAIDIQITTAAKG